MNQRLEETSRHGASMKRVVITICADFDFVQQPCCAPLSCSRFPLAGPGHFANCGFDETMQTMIAQTQRWFALSPRIGRPTSGGPVAPRTEVLRQEAQRLVARGNP